MIDIIWIKIEFLLYDNCKNGRKQKYKEINERLGEKFMEVKQKGRKINI